MNKVEIFLADDVIELENNINHWCKTQKIEPLSISITARITHNDFAAAVVVKELE